MVMKLSKQERERQLKEICSDNNLSFGGWVSEETITKLSRFYIICEKNHKTEKQIKGFVNKDKRTGCSLCSNRVKKSIDDRIDDIKTLCSELGYSYIKLTENYKYTSDKVSLICNKGHSFDVRVVAFMKQGHRCKLCSSFGFNPDKSAYVYIQSLSDKYLKFGITNNNPKRRMSAQSVKSIFSHKLLYEKKFENGHDAVDIEKIISKSVLCGVVNKCDMIDGYTETAQFSDYDKIVNIIEGY